MDVRILASRLGVTAAYASALSSFYNPDMLATRTARTKFRTWIAHRGPEMVGEVDRAFIETNLAFTGDPLIRQAVVDALELMPPIVIDYAVHFVHYFGIGESALGWREGLVNRRGPRHVILLGTARRDVIAHETAHAWLEPMLPRRGMSDAERAAAELRAATLAQKWGFTGPAADPTRAVRHGQS